MKFPFISLLLFVAATSLATAQDFDSASAIAENDLKDSLAELNSVRASIAKEKIPLLQEVLNLENQVEEKAKERQRLRRLRDNSDIGLQQLDKLVSSLKAQNEYTAGLLDEFVRTFETRIHLSETQLYSDVALEARLGLADVNIDDAARFDKQLQVVSTAVDRLEQLVGGYTFEGKALLPDESIEKGTFAAFGPTVYFSSGVSNIAGISYNKLNAAEAAVAIPGELYMEGIRRFIETNDGTIPADATLEKALKIEQGKDSITEHLAKGGEVGYVILGLGAFCLLISFFKLIGITLFRTPGSRKVQKILDHLEQGEIDEARQTSAKVSGVGGKLLTLGIDHMDDKRGTLEELLFEKILSVRPKLERFLPFMAITAAAAPLLGLLGTVTGMIKTFNLITIFGTGDAKSLSSGISEALVTTELGLVVAIPALVLHGILSRMAKEKLGRLEQTAIGFVNGVIGIRTTKDR